MKKGNLNLYIDESGSGALYEKKKNYKFFLMAGVIMDENKEVKMSKFFNIWKSKYLISPKLSLHASDLFEDHIIKKTHKIKPYRKENLGDIKIFEKAIKEIVAFLVNVRFTSKIFYIDLQKVRNELRLNPYISGKKQNIFKQVINEDYNNELLFPVTIISNKLYQYHENVFYKNPLYSSGFVYYESQTEYDLKIIKSFHKNVNYSFDKKNGYFFGGKILGITFVNKSALCSAIDVADFIAYCTMQLLREHVAKKELIISTEKFRILKDCYHSLIYSLDIKKMDVTNLCIEGLKEIKKRFKTK